MRQSSDVQSLRCRIGDGVVQFAHPQVDRVAYNFAEDVASIVSDNIVLDFVRLLDHRSEGLQVDLGYWVGIVVDIDWSYSIDCFDNSIVVVGHCHMVLHDNFDSN